jgi:predicted nucleic acid-binding protein
MAKVYLETSFISAVVTDRTDPASIYRRDASGEWWRTQRAAHGVFVTQEVLSELSHPAFRRRDEALSFVQQVPLLDINEQVRGVAELLVRERLMPKPVAGDAVHVAAATVHGMEYLLSWNVRHLANPNKLEHLEVICRRLGLLPPRIVTPDLLWEVEP